MRFVQVQGEQVPALGLGTWKLNGDQGRRTIEEALDVGYRHIDTAQEYGNEHQVGEALKARLVDRNDLFLTTKIANRNHAPEAVRSSTHASLRGLGTDYVDLLLIHWPADFDHVDATLDAMRALHDEGKVRHLGVSNFNAAQLDLAAELAPLFAIQVEYHPFLDQQEVLEVARRHDLLFTAYSPIARGKVTSDPTLREIAAERGVTPVQVALRWLVDQDHVAAVPKGSGDHLRENFDIFSFALSDDDRTRIDGLARGERLVGGPYAPEWDR